MCEVHIVKTCVGTVPAERNCSAFTVAVFGDYTFSQCLVSIFAFIVIGIAVNSCTDIVYHAGQVIYAVTHVKDIFRRKKKTQKKKK